MLHEAEVANTNDFFFEGERGLAVLALLLFHKPFKAIANTCLVSKYLPGF